jgi:hypothetical protein
MSDDLTIKKRVRFIQKVFGTALLDRDGVNVAVGCVNKKCNSFGIASKKKLTLRVDNEFYHCWVCGYRGKGLARFFKKHRPRHQAEATSLFEKRIAEIEEDVLPAVELPEGFTLLGALRKDADPDIRACRNYLFNRGFTQKELWYFKAGAVAKGRYRRRVIIPSFDSEGSLNYFTGRAIDAESGRKYLNPRVKRSEIIFNEINVDWTCELTIVEGPFDLMKANQNTTCLLGSSLNEQHMLFKRIVGNKTPVVLALDPDAIAKTCDIAALLFSFDVPVRILKIEDFSDVGEMPLGHLQELLYSAEPWDEMDRLRALISTMKSGSII